MNLTKREIIMIVLLLIVGILFIEYRVIIAPGLARYQDLLVESEQVQAQVDEINLNLSSIDTLAEKRDSNLSEIDRLSTPFINGLEPEILLQFSYDLVARNGFIVSGYGIAPIEVASLRPEEIDVMNLAYKLSDIASSYRKLQGDIGDDPNGQGDADSSEANETDDQVELLTVQISAVASYDQLLALMAEIQGMQRTITISNLDVSYFSPTELNIDLSLQFIGIRKLTDQEDPLTEWTRPVPITSEGSPYGTLTAEENGVTDATPTDAP